METRIQKHMKYRTDILKEGTTTIDMSSKPRVTGTLPINKVMDEPDDSEQNKIYARQKTIKRLQIALLIVLVIAVITGIVLFGIYAFSRG